MLKRVQKLSNIGRFQSAECGAAEFDTISIVFGRNTYGKSTFSDLLSSLATNDVSGVVARRTIPNNKNAQEAKLSFLPRGGVKEIIVTLGNNCWNYNGLPMNTMAVFDDGFFHNNIFAARQFTRSTKENFSAFILGAEGVQSAKLIAEQKKSKGEKTREQNQLIKDVFSDISNLEEFIALEPKETTEEIEKTNEELRDQSSAIKKQRDDADQIKQRSICKEVHLNYDFNSYVEQLNSALSLSIESHHKEAQQRVINHIQKHFQNTNSAESWLRQGVEQSKGDFCQFCGQPLGQSAKDLLELYKQTFDAAYKLHNENIDRLMSEAAKNLNSAPTSEIRLSLEANRTACAGYPELSHKEDYSSILAEIEAVADRIGSTLNEWETRQEEFSLQVEKACGAKRQSPQESVPSVQSEALVKILQIVQQDVSLYNSLVASINKLVAEFKDATNPENLEKTLQELTQKKKTYGLLLKRREREKQVNRLKASFNEIEQLVKSIATNEFNLQNQQSQYLKDFFVSLNKWFGEFGSKDFSLEMGSDSSGHTPVYFLKVRFKGQLIPEKELVRVFSESDRRALALAVFWSYLSSLNAETKKDLIVVLDDPVTSFDNGRITSVHLEIIKLYKQVRQVIVLSHYDVEVAKFLSTFRKNHPVCLLALETNANSSTICRKNIEDFIRSEHDQKTRRIINFVDGIENSHHAGDLRVFLEAEITSRFARQLQKIGASECMLSTKIDKLLEHGIISNQLAQDAHTWRECLNPAHHTWTSDDTEDQRRTAGRFMDFVYDSLAPA